MEEFKILRSRFVEHSNPEDAIYMKKYLRGQFDFYGIRSTNRKELYKDILKKYKDKKNIDWALLSESYSEGHREFQYFVCDYLVSMKKFIVFEDIAKIREFIVYDSWWDTIDSICKIFGYLANKDLKVKELMIKWSKDENIWIRRTAILHQLGQKQSVDKLLLKEIIENNFGSNEFFINKAIGWALRDFSKYDKDWVRNFINQNKEKMSSLSIREGSKYI